jgi:hypothetical protein
MSSFNKLYKNTLKTENTIKATKDTKLFTQNTNNDLTTTDNNILTTKHYYMDAELNIKEETRSTISNKK